MASWKCAVYGVVATLIIVLIILLNFDFLPKRKLSEELELAEKSRHKGPVTPTGITTLRTSTSTVEKDENVKVSVTQYLKDIMNWSCTEDHSHMDHLPELTFEDVKNVTWNCSNYPQTPQAVEENATKSMCYNYDDPFVCVRDPLHCHHRENSDMRFVTRPQYGDYKYLPKSLWLSVVLHGGVAFLYHPCARQDLIDQLKRMAVSCLQRHVITPYERLSPCKPIAMVAWSCFYSSSELNISEGKLWIREKAMRGPASHVSENGQYTDGLIKPAATVSDKLDTNLCPANIKSMLPLSQEPENSHSHETQHDPSQSDWSKDSGKSISIQNSQLKEVVIVNEQISNNRKVDTSNAAWALGSLMFLCAILGGMLIYTRPWKNRDHWWRMDDYNSNTKFSFMKTRGLRWKNRMSPGKRTSGYSRLLTAIPEELEDDI